MIKRMRNALHGRFGTIQGVTGALLISGGVALWSVPAALIVAGVLILADRLT